MNSIVSRLSNAHPASAWLAGIYSICSAHPWVLEAAMRQALEDETPLLIESTSNQVDQYGGYTGMKPADFVDFVRSIAERVGFSHEHLILGGDHLGPNAWRHLPVDEAMQRADALIDNLGTVRVVRHAAIWAIAAFSTQSVSGRMKAVSSASGTNSPGISP